MLYVGFISLKNVTKAGAIFISCLVQLKAYSSQYGSGQKSLCDREVMQKKKKKLYGSSNTL
jgi:hypothetical protein